MQRNTLSVKNLPPTPEETGAWMAKLRAAMFNAVTESDIAEISKSLVKRAKQGDLAATKLLLTYVCPQPSIHIGVRDQARPEPDVIDEAGAEFPSGSPEKIAAMRARASKRIGVFSPADKNGHG